MQRHFPSTKEIPTLGSESSSLGAAEIRPPSIHSTSSSISSTRSSIFMTLRRGRFWLVIAFSSPEKSDHDTITTRLGARESNSESRVACNSELGCIPADWSNQSLNIEHVVISTRIGKTSRQRNQPWRPAVQATSRLTPEEQNELFEERATAVSTKSSASRVTPSRTCEMRCPYGPLWNGRRPHLN